MGRSRGPIAASTRAMKVLQVTGAMNRGGAEVMLMDILRHKPQEVQFDFLINNPPDDLYRRGAFDDEIRAAGCRMRYIGTQLRIGPLAYARRFKAICKELQPDVVHIHLNAKCGIIAWAARRAGCRRVIAHCHADSRFHGSWLTNALNETEVFFQKFLISHYATDYWGCSPQACRRLYWPWVRKHSVVINNAIDTAAYANVKQEDVAKLRASYGLPPGTWVLGNVGRIVPHKNIAHVVDVLAALKRRGMEAALVVAGRNDAPDYVDAMMSHARELGVEQRIVLLGERADVPVVMNTFDVFVGTSLQEGFGLVAVEAQAAGVPCVLYKGFPSTVDMQLGLCQFLDGFDTERWADAIVAAHPLRHSIDTEQIEHQIALMGFDAVSNARRVCNLYKEIYL